MELSVGQPAKNLVLGLLRAYKWALSPMFPPSCRYVPTCSEYAMEAVECHGVLGGSWMALRRILRCHPFVKGGYDPVVGKAEFDASESVLVQDRREEFSSRGQDARGTAGGPFDSAQGKLPALLDGTTLG
jgi:putative membrane protein insertion efficiency factor